MTTLDPSVLYFSAEHIPCPIFAVFLSVGLVLISVLLLTLYPIQSFRSIILKFCFGGHVKAALSIFVEKFHSCYRDGLDGGRDMRSFSGFYFLLRLLAFILAAFLPQYEYGTSTWVIASALFSGSGLLIAAVIRPYKKMYMNVVNSQLLFNLSVMCAIFSQYFAIINCRNSVLFSPVLIVWLTILGTCIPICGFAVYLLVKFIIWSKRNSLWLNLKQCCSFKRAGETDHSVSAQHSNLELPGRFLHPDEYLVDSGSI